mgnify:CR=1 FL=1
MRPPKHPARLLSQRSVQAYRYTSLTLQPETDLSQGWGPNFNHRLGHFIGLSEHEFGDVSSANTWQAKPGMIFSIEPGIYLTGDTGVRVEDLVLVTENGVEVLNHYPKGLQIIG